MTIMGNALDVSPEQQNQQAMEEWIQLWHKVLLFAHHRAQQSQPPSSTISFRSLLLEYQGGWPIIQIHFLKSNP
jgi:hypothetical protein